MYRNCTAYHIAGKFGVALNYFGDFGQNAIFLKLVPLPKNDNHCDIEPRCVIAACHLKLREVSSSHCWAIFGAIPFHLRPLLRCVLAVIHLASRWDHLGACRGAVQSAPHTLISNTYFLPREREESWHCWGVYKRLSWNTHTIHIWILKYITLGDEPEWDVHYRANHKTFRQTQSYLTTYTDCCIGI